MSDEEIRYMKNKINEVKAFLVETKDKKEVCLEDLMPCMVFNKKDVDIIEKLLDLYLEQKTIITINGFKNFWEGLTNSKID